MKLSFIKQVPVRIPKTHLIEVVRFIESKLPKKYKVSHLELVLVFVDEPTIKGLNKKFRGKNKVTDVLSFDPVEEESLGELVFCTRKIKSQALQNGHSYRDELVYMMLHGILHLLGYEHECGGKKEKEMFRLQDNIFSLYLNLF
ncbi:MAG: rRNA maturation RNase YbeY [Bdellovibrionales bacterium]|nr:rRNA maturation RNase YbeY [Bdellovibrionales bacterium]